MSLGSFELFIILVIFFSYTESCNEENKSTVLSVIAESKYMSMTKKLYACNFEVFGKVQGVFFRKHTEKQAKILGIRGWCMNTAEGTVKGQLEGGQHEVNEMKNWLQVKGSPKSRIDNVVFSDTKEIPCYSYQAFAVKR